MFHVEILNQQTLQSAEKILGLKKSQIANIRAGKRELTALEALQLRQSQSDPLLCFFNWKADNKVFWNNLESLQALLGYSDQKMANAFSYNLRAFRLSRSKVKSLPWNCCEYFGYRYKVHPALWFTSELDVECLAKNILSPFKSNAYLPHIYEGGGSKMRLLANLLSYVQGTWGDNAAETLKSSLQVTQESLNFDKSISIRIFSEFHKRLRAYGACDHHFEEMGAYNKLNQKNRKILSQKIPEELIAPHKIMHYFIEHLVKSLDVNRSFKVLKSTPTDFVIEARPTQVFINAYLPDKPFAEYEIALYVKGHTKVIPTYFGLKEFKSVSLEFNQRDGSAIYNCEFASA